MVAFVHDAARRAPLPLRLKLTYALGNGGAVLGDTILASYLLFFYFPPEGRGVALAPELLFALVPTWLFVNVVARAVDSVSDPLVAGWSDKSRHRLGRRRVFMLASAIPLAISTAALFFPPFPGAAVGNAVFLVVAFSAYFVLFTVYVAPYLALVPELGQTEAERVDLTTFQAAFGLAGAGIAMVLGPALLPSEGETSADVQRMVVVLAGISLVMLMVPALFVDERRWSAWGEGAVSDGLLESLKRTLANRRFRYYLVGTVLFYFGFNVVRGATPYFVTVLMKQPLAFQMEALLAVFVVAALAFPVVNLASKRFGKRPVVIGGAFVLAVGLALVATVDSALSGIVILGIAGAGVSVLLVVPNALLSDICEEHARETGQRSEAMFFGAQGFFLKVNLGVSSGVLGLLFSTFGTSVENPLGVRLAGPVAAVVLGLAILAYWRMPADRDG